MKNIVFLTGSGISKESGIPTFRDCGDGLWNNYPVEEVATIQGYMANREKVLDFYNIFRNKYKDCQPCDAHKLIAKLSKTPGYSVTVITQNVDNLHESAGSQEIIHLHGNMAFATSEKNPGDPEQHVPYPETGIRIGDKAPDGSQLRPFIVWFGEDVPEYTKAVQVIHKADIVVIIGTSLQVYPAAGLATEVPPEKKLYVIDPADVEIQDDGLYEICPPIHIKKSASDGMKELYRILGEQP